MAYQSELFAVKNDGSFYKRCPPVAADDNWISTADKIGNAEWESFKFLFFGPAGDLYAVPQDGSFLALLLRMPKIIGSLVQQRLVMRNELVLSFCFLAQMVTCMLSHKTDPL